ncbi:unnamed protein product, partial [Heterotrigona itama]
VTTTDGEQADDSFDSMDIPSEMSPPAATSSSGPILPEAAGDEKGLKTGSSLSIDVIIETSRSEFCIGCSDIQRTSSVSNLLDETDAPPVDAATPILIRGTVNDAGKVSSVCGRTPPLPDLRATDFFSTPVRGSVDAGQSADTSDANSTLLSLMAGRGRGEEGNGENRGANDIDEKKKHGDGKRNVNVTTNPLDISSIGARADRSNNGGRQSSDGPARTSATNKPRGRFAGGNASGNKRSTQAATIVVQQPSLSLDGSSGAATILLHPELDVRRREENMRQLLDVANTLTLEEMHDFEMRYGSPHHSRSQSVKTPGSRSSGRPNYLCLPQQRSRVASMPNTGVEEEYYRLRHFSITGKGIVNRGDSLKSRRSRSNNSVASSNSSTEHLTASYPGSARNSAAGSLASSRESSASQGPTPYRVLMLGAAAVGKSSLVSQFMTSEYLHAYDTSIDDESGEKTVSVLLAGEESELTFIDHSSAETTVGCVTPVRWRPRACRLDGRATNRRNREGEGDVEPRRGSQRKRRLDEESVVRETSVGRNGGRRSKTETRKRVCSQAESCVSAYEPHAYCVVYSTTDRGSVRVAEEVLQTLWRSDYVSARAVILVGNKVDLVRSRSVSTEGEMHGDVLRLQVHRDVGGDQSQRGRASGGVADANSAEAGESGENEGPVSEEIAKEAEQVAGGMLVGEQFAEEVSGESDERELEGAEFTGEGMGERQQVEELRESARSLTVGRMEEGKGPRGVVRPDGRDEFVGEEIKKRLA